MKESLMGTVIVIGISHQFTKIKVFVVNEEARQFQHIQNFNDLKRYRWLNQIDDKDQNLIQECLKRRDIPRDAHNPVKLEYDIHSQFMEILRQFKMKYWNKNADGERLSGIFRFAGRGVLNRNGSFRPQKKCDRYTLGQNYYRTDLDELLEWGRGQILRKKQYIENYVKGYKYQDKSYFSELNWMKQYMSGELNAPGCQQGYMDRSNKIQWKYDLDDIGEVPKLVNRYNEKIKSMNKSWWY